MYRLNPYISLSLPQIMNKNIPPFKKPSNYRQKRTVFPNQFFLIDMRIGHIETKWEADSTSFKLHKEQENMCPWTKAYNSGLSAQPLLWQLILRIITNWKLRSLVELISSQRKVINIFQTCSQQIHTKVTNNIRNNVVMPITIQEIHLDLPLFGFEKQISA